VFKHTLLIAVTFDGNDNIVILAFAACDIEDEENWVWFLLLLTQDFPGMKVFMSDADKGITSNRFQAILARLNARGSRCLRHMIGNCRESITSKLSHAQEEHVWKIGKARSGRYYEAKLEPLRIANPQAATWFDARNSTCYREVLLRSSIHVMHAVS